MKKPHISSELTKYTPNLTQLQKTDTCLGCKAVSILAVLICSNYMEPAPCMTLTL